MTETTDAAVQETTVGNTQTISLKINGKTLNIRQMPARPMTKFAGQFGSIFKQLNFSGGFDPFQLIEVAGDGFCDLLAVAIGKPVEYFDTISMEDCIEIAEAVWKVNGPVILGKLVPKLLALVEEHNPKAPTAETAKA